MTITQRNRPRPPRRRTRQAPRPEAEEVDRIAIKRRLLLQRLREAEALAARIQELPDGSRVFLRFGKAERYQHFVLMATFATLAVTGLLQHFSRYLWVALTINALGGVEALRTVHHVAAVLLIAVSLYHVWRIAELWFVKRQRGAMWPQLQDFLNLFQMVKYNLGLATTPPLQERFAIEEKMEYWALLWGQTVMVITGLIMWFPIAATKALPGGAIPVSRALHAWEAILATLAILTWHVYHVHLKVHNWSIFTGYMSEEEMLEEHPLEYRRILAAREMVAKIREELAALESGKAGGRKPGPPAPAAATPEVQTQAAPPA